jgi:hypothetical protein
MKTRTLLDGSTVPELENPVTLQIKTKCPAKYKLVDMETGQTYTGYDTEGKHFWKPTGVDKQNA